MKRCPLHALRYIEDEIAATVQTKSNATLDCVAVPSKEGRDHTLGHRGIEDKIAATAQTKRINIALLLMHVGFRQTCNLDMLEADGKGLQLRQM